MYSYDQRITAVELYIKYRFRAAAVIRELGYPNRHMLVKWFKEYEETGDLRKTCQRCPKFSEEQKAHALDYYVNHGYSINLTVNALGYPSKTVFKEWLNDAYPNRSKHCVSGGVMIEYPQETKEQAVVDLCARTGSAKEVAADHGVSCVSLYKWKRQLLGEERSTVMLKKKKQPPVDVDSLEKRVADLQAEEAALREKLHRAQLEYDILEKAAELLKKDQGISLAALTNRDKAIVIDALRKKYKLRDLLPVLKIAKSSYCYQSAVLHRDDKYKDIKMRIKEIFNSVNRRYGYRRIHCLLRNEAVVISEKVVRRIMRDTGLVVSSAKMKKYSSYVGEVSPSVENLVKRNFHADAPNKLWLTDITEFRIAAGRVYLSPMIDCFDGLPVSWTIGTTPSADLANTMLDAAISTLKENEHPVVHSDRGGHYRWHGWIERMDRSSLVRSMSKKGCSPDNAACEGFHGRLKNEFFYNRDWKNITLTDFISQLDEYLHWYCEERIKLSLGGLSPIQYRRSLGIII